jgi:hypothetical protein
MLPDVSSRITAANGVSSASKDLMSCSTPSSKTRKNFCVRPPTAFPEASVIDALRTTIDESTEMISSSSFCAEIVIENRKVATRKERIGPAVSFEATALRK